MENLEYIITVIMQITSASAPGMPSISVAYSANLGVVELVCTVTIITFSVI